jgi:hypothetical protein
LVFKSKPDDVRAEAEAAVCALGSELLIPGGN